MKYHELNDRAKERVRQLLEPPTGWWWEEVYEQAKAEGATKGFRIDAVAATLGPSKGIPAHPAGELAVDFGSVDGGINKSGSASTSEDTGDKSATTTTAKSGNSAIAFAADSPKRTSRVRMIRNPFA